MIRYGFHGLSYESIVGQLRAQGDANAGGRLVIAHLGNGASMAAVRDGRGVDTTMGFTPTGGLVMGTRSGDLDPGVLLYLLRERGMARDGGERARQPAGRVARRLGDQRGHARPARAVRREDPRAADAVALFCYQAKKHPRRPGRRARRAGHARLHGRHRRARGAGPRAHLRRSRVPRDRDRCGAERGVGAGHLGGRQPPSRFGSCGRTRTR